MEVCPVGFFCFDKNTFMLLIIACIMFVVFYINKNNSSINKLNDYIQNNNNKLQSQLIELTNQNKKLDNKLENNKHQIGIGNQIADEARYLANKDLSRIINPLVPPERSYPYKINQIGIPVNIPTRGYSTGYQQVGVLIENGDDENKKLLPLYGEQTWPGSRQWKYYTSSDGYQSVKLPVIINNRNCQGSNGCNEIYDGETIKVQGYNEKNFKANIYKLDGPRYIPYIV